MKIPHFNIGGEIPRKKYDKEKMTYSFTKEEAKSIGISSLYSSVIFSSSPSGNCLEFHFLHRPIEEFNSNITYRGITTSGKELYLIIL